MRSRLLRRRHVGAPGRRPRETGESIGGQRAIADLLLRPRRQHTVTHHEVARDEQGRQIEVLVRLARNDRDAVFARGKLQLGRLPVERVVARTQAITRLGVGDASAIQLEGIRFRDVAQHLLALRRLLVQAHGASRARHRIAEGEFARDETNALDPLRNLQHALLLLREVHAMEIRGIQRKAPLHVLERTHPRTDGFAWRQRTRREQLDATSRQREGRLFPVAHHSQPPLAKGLQTEHRGGAVRIDAQQQLIGGSSIRIEDLDGGLERSAAEGQCIRGRKSLLDGLLLREGSIFMADEDERQIRGLALVDEAAGVLVDLEHPEESRDIRRLGARVCGARGGGVGIADGNFAFGDGLARPPSGGARLVRQHAGMALVPGIDRSRAGEIAVLLHEATFVHHVHAGDVVVDAVEGALPEQAAERSGRVVRGATGVEFDEAPVAAVQNRLAGDVVGHPFDGGAALVLGVVGGADFVHAGEGFAPQAEDRIAVAAGGPREMVLGDHVPREENTLPIAPRADAVEVGGAEAFPDQIGVDGPDIRRRTPLRGRGIRPADLQPPLDIRPERASRRGPVLGLETRVVAERNDRTPLFKGHGRGMPGLVCEDPQHSLVVEPLLQTAGVDFVRQFDEPVDRGRLVDIHPSTWREGRCPAIRAIRIAVDAKFPVAPRVVLVRNASLAGPARPIVLVVQPHLHAALRGLVAEPLGQAQPVLAHVFEFEAAAGIDEEGLDALLGDRRHLRADLRLGGLARDRQERNHAVPLGENRCGQEAERAPQHLFQCSILHHFVPG